MRINVETVKRYMEEHGLSQVQFASLTGITQADISRMLRSKRGGGIKSAGKLLLAMPAELWPDLLVFDDGTSVFREYERRMRGGGEAGAAG